MKKKRRTKKNSERKPEEKKVTWVHAKRRLGWLKLALITFLVNKQTNNQTNQPKTTTKRTTKKLLKKLWKHKNIFEVIKTEATTYKNNQQQYLQAFTDWQLKQLALLFRYLLCRMLKVDEERYVWLINRYDTDTSLPLLVG